MILGKGLKMIRAHEMIEFEYKGKEPEGSCVIVDLRAEFIGPDKNIFVKGFYDGNGIYKVRFLPETTGSYRYKVSGLVTEEGSFFVEPADDKHHGIVRADGTHLRYADGKYIHTFGTTVYALAHQDDELTEETFKSLECGAFNKIRICVFPKHYVYNHNEPKYFAFERDVNAEVVSFTDNLGEHRTVQQIDTDRPVYEFWQDFEHKLERLFEMGIQVDLILFHPYDRWGHSHMSSESNLRYLDYTIRRLAAYPNIWWSIANEYDLFLDWNIEKWHEIDEFIADNDPFHHLLSNHNCFPTYDYSRDAITHVSIQTRTMTRVAELQKKYGKPILYDECCYEGNLKETWGALSAKEMVNRFWKVTTTGGYCTHGEVLLDDSINTPTELDNAVLWWAKGGKLKGESPKRIKFLREFVESLPAPLDPLVVGLSKMFAMSRDEMNEAIKKLPEENKAFVNVLLSMDEKELQYTGHGEYIFAGHIGEEVYLYYLANDCCARYMPELPQGKTYSVEVIDAWNMTREKIAEGIKRGDEIRLPGREYMAIFCIADQGK